MSVIVDDIDKTKLYIRKKLYDGTNEKVKLYIKENDKYRIPFLYGRNNYDVIKQTSHHYNSEFYGTLRDYQIKDYKETIKQLKINKCVFLCLHCGYGKTIMGIKIACKLRLKTLILVDQTLIKTGWIKTVLDLTNVDIMELGNKISNSQFVITHIINLRKYTSEELSCFQVVIVDEALYFMTEKRIKLLMKLTPKYLIGMCAEIKRDDMMHKALYYFFTDKNMIVSKDIKSVKLYVLQTTYKPTLLYRRYGKETRLDWNTVLNSIAENEDRTKKICNIVSLFRNEKCIIVSKRKEQCKQIYKNLKSRNIDVKVLLEKDKNFKNCNILVSTYSKLFKGFDAEKCCIGYDNKPFRLIFIISDVVKPEQLVGRVMRSSNPIVFYFLDDHAKFRKHYLSFEKYFKTKVTSQINKEWI